jgi:hypothetical protein
MELKVWGAHAAVFVVGGRIRNKEETCSYYETFDWEWSSYFLIWAATKRNIGHMPSIS